MCVLVGPRFLMDASAQDSLVVRAGDTIRVPVTFEVSISNGCGEGPQVSGEPGSAL